MGVKYVSVDSMDRRAHENTSRIHVELSEPIEHATSVEVVSFSTANEFFNVVEDYNLFRIIIYAPLLANPTSGSINLEVAPGLYTGTQLVDALNAQAVAAAANPVTGVSVTVTFTLDVGGRVILKVSTSAAAVRRAVIFQEGRNYAKSIPYRLGFSKQQTLRVNNRLNAGAPVGHEDIVAIGVIYNLIRRRGLGDNTIEYMDPRTHQFYAEDDPDFPDDFPYEVWRTENAAQNGAQGEGIVGNHILFEAHPFVTLRSSLVSDYTKTLMEDDAGHPNGHFSTCQDSVLCKINIDVNVYSWVHYESHLNQTMVHELSGKPINSFWIELSDQTGEAFRGMSFKDYNVILKFETVDPHAERNEAAIKAYVEQIFLERMRVL